MHKTDKVDSPLFSHLGFAELNLGNYENAIYYLRKAVRADPGYAPVYHFIAQYYWKIGEFNIAKSYYIKAQSLDPYNEVYKKNYKLIQKNENLL